MEATKHEVAALEYFYGTGKTRRYKSNVVLEHPLTRSAIDARDFGAFEGQVIHQPLLIEDETDHGAADAVGIDGTACSDRDDRHRSVHPDLPAIRALKTRQRLLGHEHDDDRARLRAELKTDRTGNDVVIARVAAADVQRAFAIFAANAKSCFD